MKLPRRKFLQLAAAAAAAPASQIVTAETYPMRPITIIDTYAAGGITDLIERIMAESMRKRLGQPIIIENVAGADGNIGTGRAARARADGHTITLGTISTHVLNGALYSLPYDVLNDFAPISPLASAPMVLYARKTMPAKNLRELIAWLKAHPNKASAGIAASTARLLTAFFQKETATQFAFVPYRGSPPCTAGPGDRSDRLHSRYTVAVATGSGEQHKSLCSDKRHAFGACAGYSDLC
jgi:tripartite-type tricarboxylate transporter receptor subunit TctC